MIVESIKVSSLIPRYENISVWRLLVSCSEEVIIVIVLVLEGIVDRVVIQIAGAFLLLMIGGFVAWRCPAGMSARFRSMLLVTTLADDVELRISERFFLEIIIIAVGFLDVAGWLTITIADISLSSSACSRGGIVSGAKWTDWAELMWIGSRRWLSFGSAAWIEQSIRLWSSATTSRTECSCGCPFGEWSRRWRLEKFRFIV